MLFPPPNQGPLCPVFTLFSLTDSHAIDSNLTPFPLDSSWQFGDDCVTERVLSARLQQVNGAIVVFVHLSWITGKIRWNMIQVRLQIQRSLPYSGSLFHLISNLMSHASSQRMRKRLSTTWTGQNSTQTFGFLTVLKTKFTKWTNWPTLSNLSLRRINTNKVCIASCKLLLVQNTTPWKRRNPTTYRYKMRSKVATWQSSCWTFWFIINHISWKLAISYHNISDLSQSCQNWLCLVNHVYPDWSYLIVSYLTVSHHTFSSRITWVLKAPDAMPPRLESLSAFSKADFTRSTWANGSACCNICKCVVAILFVFFYMCVPKTENSPCM